MVMDDLVWRLLNIHARFMDSLNTCLCILTVSSFQSLCFSSSCDTDRHLSVRHQPLALTSNATEWWAVCTIAYVSWKLKASYSGDREQIRECNNAWLAVSRTGTCSRFKEASHPEDCQCHLLARRPDRGIVDAKGKLYWEEYHSAFDLVLQSTKHTYLIGLDADVSWLRCRQGPGRRRFEKKQYIFLRQRARKRDRPPFHPMCRPPKQARLLPKSQAKGQRRHFPPAEVSKARAKRRNDRIVYLAHEQQESHKNVSCRDETHQDVRYEQGAVTHDRSAILSTKYPALSSPLSFVSS